MNGLATQALCQASSRRDLARLRELAAAVTDPEDAAAIDTTILQDPPQDSVARNRLGRADEALGAREQARGDLPTGSRVDPNNAIAAQQQRTLIRRR